MSAVAVALFLMPASVAGQKLFQPMLRGPATAPISYGTPHVQAYGSYGAERVDAATSQRLPGDIAFAHSAGIPVAGPAPEDDAGSNPFRGALLLSGVAFGLAAAAALRHSRPASPHSVALLSVRGDDGLELGDIMMSSEPTSEPLSEATSGGDLLDPLGRLGPAPARKAPRAAPASAPLDRVATTLSGFLEPADINNALDAFTGKDRRSFLLKNFAAGSAAAAVLGARPAFAANFQGTPMALSSFFEAVDQNKVEKVVISSDGKELLMLDVDGNRNSVRILPGESTSILEKLRTKKISFAVEPPRAEGSNNPFFGFANLVGGLVNFLFPLFLINLLLNAARGGGMGGPGGMGGGSPFDVGKSKSKLEMEPNTGVTFQDVAGCDEAKLELVEVVDFLKNPGKFTKVGAKSPRGVLLEGPPGTGKTLLARAIAGEAGVPFTSASGSEFVEMFVGVGASRVRDLFKKAKENSPCIIFIDEIDAIGRQRAGASGGGMGGGGNDEREQTLNQILTEMDGFEGNSGVIVVAATNRGDVLDNALLRPGRFDRRVPVGLPDKDGRVEILKVHTRGKPLADGVNLDTIAARTTGFSGASLQNLMNEAAIYAARAEKEVITFEEIDQAIDRITVGLTKRTGMSNEKRQKLVAYHEAGHAIMGVMTPEYDPVAKITILPRSNGAGGFTLFVPNEDRMDGGMYSLRYLKAQLAVALGGRVSEEIVFGEDEVTTGASGDLQQVRSIARRMVTQWGFAGEDLGMTAWESADGSGPFGRTAASEEKEAAIDVAVSKLCDEAYETTMKTLTEHRAIMDELVNRLLEKETVDGFELADLVQEMTGKPAPAYAAIPVAVQESLKAQRAMEGKAVDA